MRNSIRFAVTVVWMAVPLSGQAPLTWSRLSPPLGFPASVNATAIFDDGNGASVYAGGNVGFADGMTVRTGAVARWNGTHWSGIQAPIEGEVFALMPFHDGIELALYVGGEFTCTGTLAGARNLVRWNGTTWSDVPGIASGRVSALAVYDDGTGPALYAGGSFPAIDATPVGYVAKWNGASWSPLAGGVGPVLPPGVAGYSVSTLTVHDDGGGPGLYVGGNFLQAGSVNARSVARWRGGQWAALGNGLSPMDVLALASFGGSLYAGGSFQRSGSVNVESIARFNGTAWVPVGAGFGSPVVTPGGGSSIPYVWALQVFDDGTGPALYAGGRIGPSGSESVNGIARWNGTSWSSLGNGVAIDGDDFSEVMTLTVGNVDGAPALYVGGIFTQAGGIDRTGIARWSANAWHSVGGGLQTGTQSPSQMISKPLVTREIETAAGPRLILGGNFRWVGTQPAQRVALWNGVSWNSMGSGLPNSPSDFVGWTGGGSDEIYATVHDQLWKWSGTDWVPSAQSLDFMPQKLAVFDSGTGRALHAVGAYALSFASAPGFARWTGTEWVELGSSGGGSFSFTTRFSSLSVHDLGTGPALYATGTANSTPYATYGFVWRWDGTSSTAVAYFADCDPDPKAYPVVCTGLTTSVAAFDDGNGLRLAVSGSFQGWQNVAAFDGTSWQSLGAGTAPQGRLFVHDNGLRPRLHIAIENQGIFGWDGVNWVPLSDAPVGIGTVPTTFDDGGGRDIVLSGVYSLNGALAELGLYISRSHLDSHVGDSVGVPLPTLAVGTSTGWSTSRSLVLEVQDPFQVRMLAPPMAPVPEDFAVFAMLGPPDVSTLTSTPFGVFSMPLPYPGGPTLWLASSVGNASVFQTAPAPWTWSSSGVLAPMVVTLHGAVVDATSPTLISITNGMVLHFQP
jgi:hypothetical protein